MVFAKNIFPPLKFERSFLHIMHVFFFLVINLYSGKIANKIRLARWATAKLHGPTNAADQIISIRVKFYKLWSLHSAICNNFTNLTQFTLENIIIPDG